MKAIRFISTIIAVTVLTAIFIAMVIVIANLEVNRPILATLLGACVVAGMAGAICEALERMD